jgi:hypothetical protein
MQSGAPPKSTLTLQPKKQKFTLVPQIDRYPKLVEFGQTIFGKLLISCYSPGRDFYRS